MLDEIKQNIREKSIAELFCEDLSITWDDVIEIINIIEKPKGDEVKFSNLGRAVIHVPGSYSNSHPALSRIKSEMSKLFNNNFVSCHMYVSFRKESISFPPHKDGMDVMYCQALNSINMKIYPHKDGSKYNTLTKSSVEDVGERSFHSKKMIPGDMIWIPRGTYHHIVPLESRVGFSFGVERGPDPCTYV